MKNAEVSRQLQRLKALIKIASGSTNQPELLSHWARYFCVVTAGLVENSVRELYSEFIRRTSQNQIARYAVSQILSIKNPNAEKLVQIARKFDPVWAVAIENFMKDEGRKEAVDAIMTHRHNIAHGKDTGITLIALKEYLKKVESVVEYIEGRTNP